MKCIKCNSEHDGSYGSGKYCSIKCANSRIFSEESKEKKRIKNINQIPWNKDKKCVKPLKRDITICLFCGGEIEHYKSTPKKYHSECWLKASGGYRKGSGIGKKGWYKGVWCDSSYELVWVIYHIDHNIKFERNKQKYPYIWKGKIKNYIPDFIVNGEIIEIKGYVNAEVKEKLNSCPNLKILFKKDLIKEFEYVINTYGKNFTEMYE